MESYIVDNYSTLTTRINALVVQHENNIVSDQYEIIVDFAWTNNDHGSSNVAFLKMKFFLEEIVDQSIITHTKAIVDTSSLSNNTILLPFVPSTDTIAMVLHAKLVAIVGEDIFIYKVAVKHDLPDFSMKFTYSDRDYAMLPTMDEFTEGLHTYYDNPWWCRGTCETIDWFSADSELVSECPPYYNAFEEIEGLVDDLNGVPKGDTEVIDFHTWKPKIVDE